MPAQKLSDALVCLCICAVAGCDCSPATITTGKGPDAAYGSRGTLICDLSTKHDSAMTVRWRYTNCSDDIQWVPVKIGVYSLPDTVLPQQFLTPDGRLMAVSALFWEWPPDRGIEEGEAKVELFCVKPGATFEGVFGVPIPFHQVHHGDGGRPNPFALREETEEMSVALSRRISGFQMAVQVYRLPDAVVREARREHATLDGSVIVYKNMRAGLLVLKPELGTYYAEVLSQCDRRYPRISDLSEWSVSPVYRVDWPVSLKHPRVAAP